MMPCQAALLCEPRQALGDLRICRARLMTSMGAARLSLAACFCNEPFIIFMPGLFRLSMRII